MNSARLDLPQESRIARRHVAIHRRSRSRTLHGCRLLTATRPLRACVGAGRPLSSGSPARPQLLVWSARPMPRARWHPSSVPSCVQEQCRCGKTPIDLSQFEAHRADDRTSGGFCLPEEPIAPGPCARRDAVESSQAGRQRPRMRTSSRALGSQVSSRVGRGAAHCPAPTPAAALITLTIAAW